MSSHVCAFQHLRKATEGADYTLDGLKGRLCALVVGV